MNSDKEPLVSVLLPVYNASETVRDSVLSIINQRYRNWELIIVNDGSTDLSEEVILSIKDSRIKYYTNLKNEGLIYSLNKGISLSNGEYIARMDADDIAHHLRLEKQVSLLQSTPSIIVCGTDVEVFGNKKTKHSSFKLIRHSKVMKNYLAKAPCFVHPTVMIRKSVLNRLGIVYDKNYVGAEDYKLWIDLMSYGDYSNIPEKLLYYRLSETQITQSNNKVQIANAKKCRWCYLIQTMGADFVERLRNEGVDIEKMKQIRKNTDNKFIWEVAYLSMNSYGPSELGYYFCSLDFMRFRFTVLLRIVKRFLKGRNSLL